jgi:hypothetical protein
LRHVLKPHVKKAMGIPRVNHQRNYKFVTPQTITACDPISSGLLLHFRLGAKQRTRNGGNTHGSTQYRNYCAR